MSHNLLVTLLIAGFISCSRSTEIQPVSTPVPPDSNSRCEPIDGVPICQTMNWPNATFPNYRQHLTQVEANAEVIDFYQVIRTGCSPAIVHFLCSYYTPACLFKEPGGEFITVPPCRELCQMVRDGCEHIYQSCSLQWPSHLDCERFPLPSEGMVCLLPPQNQLVIPANVHSIIPQISCTSSDSVSASVSPASTVNIAPSATAPTAPVCTSRVDCSLDGTRPTTRSTAANAGQWLHKFQIRFRHVIKSYFCHLQHCGILADQIFVKIRSTTVLSQQCLS